MSNLYEEPQSFWSVSVLLFIILFLSLGGKRCWWRSKRLGADGRIPGVKGRKGWGRDVNNRSVLWKTEWERRGEEMGTERGGDAKKAGDEEKGEEI